MKRPVAGALRASLLVVATTLSSLSGAQAVPDKQAALGQARDSYYNLRNQGLVAFQCAVTPNWELLLQTERQQNSAGVDSAIKILNQLQFNVYMAADGTIKLTHNDLPGQNKEMMDALQQIYGGMEQMTSGFFDTWKLFMLNHPFPEVSSVYDLRAAGPDYRLTYKENTADVATTMSREFRMSSLHVITPEFDSTIEPTLTTSPKGFVLRAYEASYKSQKPEETTQLKVLIGYQDVEGLEMLQQLKMSGTYGGTPFAVELGFSNCQVTKR